MPSSMKKWFAIARVTFHEILLDRIAYHAILLSALLLMTTLLVSGLSFLRPERIVIDFGLSAVSLSCLAMGILLGAPLLPREFERRTIFVALSKPIRRSDFLIGKFLGLAAVLLLNWTLMTIGVFIILKLVNGAFQITLFQGLFLSYVMSLVGVAIAVFFSSFTTISLSVFLSLGVYLIGTNLSQLETIVKKAENPVFSNLIRNMKWIFPNFEVFMVGPRVTYNLSLSASYIFGVSLYALVLIFILLGLASIGIEKKEV
jgi:Cu-processing system permease protein